MDQQRRMGSMSAVFGLWSNKRMRFGQLPAAVDLHAGVGDHYSVDGFAPPTSGNGAGQPNATDLDPHGRYSICLTLMHDKD